MKIETLIQDVVNGSLSIEMIKTYVKNCGLAFRAWIESLPFWGAISGVVNTIESFDTYIFIALGLITLLFGKKLLPVFKFIGCFLIGYGAGVQLLAPLVSFVPSFVVGLVIGVIAALLCKILYYIGVAFLSGYGAYALCSNGLGIAAVDGFLKGNKIYSLIVGAVVVLLVLLLLKWFEMLGTAVIGGYLIAYYLHSVWAYLELSFVAGIEAYVFYGFMGLLALVGFIVQVKTRKRY